MRNYLLSSAFNKDFKDISFFENLNGRPLHKYPDIS